MKILLYNWMNYDDPQKRGGGVRVYQANLVAELNNIPGIIVYTLSSGVSYDLFSRRAYIRKRHGAGSLHSYEIVNSPVAAPAHAAFTSLDIYLNDTSLRQIVKEFLDIHGPFDTIQFDNLEGLTAGVLSLKDQFPKTCFIYYMHNYNLVCPQVNLWFSEYKTCENYNEGKRCSVCLPTPITMQEVKLAHAISTFLQSVGIGPDSFIFRMIYRKLALARRVKRKSRSFVGRFRRKEAMVPGPTLDTTTSRLPGNLVFSSNSSGSIYKQYRESNVWSMNNNFDHVLAVSSRVRELAIQFGIARQKISVAYIGTSFAKKLKPVRVRESDYLQIAYLGYEKSDKGFYHFIDTLEAIPRATAQKISVLIAVKLQSTDILNRLKRLSVEFHDFEIVDGYDHNGLGQLLANVDLGIIPVLWEDALPQVAIEFVAHGVPVLSSDLGGTKELCGTNSKFVYRHGNARDLISKLQFFMYNRSALQTFSYHGLTLMDMEQHVKLMLDRFYILRSELPISVQNIEIRSAHIAEG